MRHFDFVVIGGGLAGLYTAHFLARSGRVALVARASLEESNSYYAQGGIAAVTDSTDTPEQHYADTMEAGRGLCNPQAVDVLTREAPARIDELMAMGMHFDTEGDHLALGLEGGHHRKRILHAGGDATGRLVTSFMISKIEKDVNIEIFDHHIACELIIEDGACRGAWFYNEREHRIETFLTGAVVLAMGGAGALYTPTTNPPTALGDGLALAYCAGARLADLEFVQFHPTALYVPGNASFLVSEAVRGEGAFLLNSRGERFMTQKHPLAELAPRDVVARSIFEQMEQSGEPCVTLSLKHLNAEWILRRFPTIAEHCRRLGLDMTQEIPVSPAAHYTVGGVCVDLHGATSVPRLYAVGEVASSGVMGANRLASNSLIECLVFGKRIADYATRSVFTEDCRWSQSLTPPVALTSREASLQWHTRQEPEYMQHLGALLMTNVGIVRSHHSLSEAVQQIESTLKELNSSVSGNIYARLTYNRHLVAWLIARAALLRTESRGGHFRSDYPQTNPVAETYRTLICGTQITHVSL